MTRRQRSIVRYIAAHPGASYREIANGIGVKSAGYVINRQLKELRALGVITFTDGKTRTVLLAPGIFVNSKGNVLKVWTPDE